MPAKLALSALLIVALTACGTASHARPKVSAPAARIAYKTQPVSTHGIELEVPAAWKLNQGSCGTPTANTVLWNTGAILACLIPRPRGVSAVIFGGLPAPTKHAPEETIGGVRVLELTKSRGRYVQLYVPRRGISVAVFSPHATLVRQIVASLHAVRTDNNGCPSRPPSGGYRLGSPPRSGQSFIPPGATRLVGCYYDGQWLDDSSSVGGYAAQRVAKVMNNAPYGFSRAPRGTIASSECAPSWHAFSVAHFEYANRPRVAVTVHPDGCTRLGASNGKWGVRMSHAWVPTFWRNVAYNGSIADRWAG